MTKEPMKKYLETLAGYSKEVILSKLKRKFKLSDSQAFEVYRRWRNEYINPNYVYSTRVSEEIIDEKSFIKMIEETSNYPITKKQIRDILVFDREGKSSDWISKHVGISYNRVFSIIKKAVKRGIL